MQDIKSELESSLHFGEISDLYLFIFICDYLVKQEGNDEFTLVKYASTPINVNKNNFIYVLCTLQKKHLY